MSDIKNVNLKTAQFALKCVETVKDAYEDKKKDEEKNRNVNKEESKNRDKKENKKITEPKKYKTLVKKMPVMIQKNGYIAVLAFCYSKSRNNKEHDEVLNNILAWNSKNEKIKGLVDNYSDAKKYIEEVVKLDQSKYRLIAKEMIFLFGWIKRFADGMIEGGDNES